MHSMTAEGKPPAETKLSTPSVDPDNWLPPPPTKAQRHNFWCFVGYYVSLRVGWVFKTESVVVPAFLDLLGANASVRGLLPVLSRLGNSIPQFVISCSVRRHALFRPIVFWTTVIMAVPWLILGTALLQSTGAEGPVWITAFLVLYGGFWVANGISLLGQGTLQGKLIPVTQRGRLLSVSNSLGCVAAIVALLLWMLPNLQPGRGSLGYGYVFLATGVLFLVTAGFVLWFREDAVPSEESHVHFRDYLRQTAHLLRGDARFRRLLLVVSLFYMILALFPHFASYGFRRAGATIGDLVFWVVIQNAGTALGSVLFGRMVDRHGNKKALGLLLVGLALVPIAAIVIAHTAGSAVRVLYCGAFFLLGLTPVAQKTVTNYVLELSPVERHTDYISTLNLWQLTPLVMSPMLGVIIDYSSFETGFLIGSLVIFASAALSKTLVEPRFERN